MRSLRFWLKLVRRVPRALVEGPQRAHTTAAGIAAVLAATSPEWARAATDTWHGVSRWWAVLFFAMAVMVAMVQAANQIRDEERKPVVDLTKLLNHHSLLTAGLHHEDEQYVSESVERLRGELANILRSTDDRLDCYSALTNMHTACMRYMRAAPYPKLETTLRPEYARPYLNYERRRRSSPALGQAD